MPFTNRLQNVYCLHKDVTSGCEWDDKLEDYGGALERTSHFVTAAVVTVRNLEFSNTVVVFRLGQWVQLS